MYKQCKICKQRLPQSDFWRYKKNGTKFLINKSFTRYHTCKNCCEKIIVIDNPSTFLPILQEMNIPYFKLIYNQYINTPNTFGKYLNRMCLGNLYDLEYEDTERLNKGEMENV